MTVIRAADIDYLSDLLAAELGTISGKTWGVRLHDAINRDVEQPNNDDGISRFVVFGGLEYDNTTAHSPIATLTWRVLCDGLAATDYRLKELRDELVEIVGAFAIRGGPLHTRGTDDLCCTRAALLSGADGGLSEDDAVAGYFTSGCELAFEW